MKSSKNPGNRNALKPTYFSDHFKIDKAKLKELGVFDPILNFDTKVFVEPLLLKKSSSKIIRNAANSYNQFFVNLLKLLKLSKMEGDMPWRQAKRIIHFPEYKYPCIGYRADSIHGSGSGASLNDKILQSAKDIVDFAKDDPSIFVILPLLEEGVGADIISDMTLNIIDEEVCNYTVDVMKKIGLEGNFLHKAKNRMLYNLPYNPFSKCPVKLLPEDILSNLPLAESFDEWLVKMADFNKDLRESVSKHIGETWFEATKSKKKEQILDLLKNDHPFFMDVLKALKEHNFEPYDLGADYQGLHRWLKDSEKFIKIDPAKQRIGFLDDSLESISAAVEMIISHFKQSIEDEELWRIFWTKHHSKLVHVNEFYSQMLFYAVCNAWIVSKDNNLSCARIFDKESKQINFIFSVLGKFSVNVQVKHSDNYGGLEKGYGKRIKFGGSRQKEKDFYIVMNFDQNPSKQLEAIRKSEKEGFKIIEINAADQDSKSDFDFETPELEFDNMRIEFDNLSSFDDRYIQEKRKAGASSYQKYKPLKRKVEELCRQELKSKKLV